MLMIKTQQKKLDQNIKSFCFFITGKSVKSWKRRWFVLSANGYLYYYENSTCKNEKGKIDLIEAKTVAPYLEVPSANKIPVGFSARNSFAIVTKDRTYTCVCENDGDST